MRCRSWVRRDPPPKSRNRSSSRRAISTGGIDPTRAAANSSASGIPSRLRQISITAATLPASTTKPSAAAPACSANNWTAAVARASPGGAPSSRQVQGPDAAHLFTLEAQRFATRDQHVHVGRVRQHDVHQLCSRVEDVLTVVQQDEHPPIGEVRGQRLTTGRRRTYRSCDRVHDLVVARDRSQLDEPAPVRELRRDRCCDSEREAGLAHAAHARQCHELLTPDQLRERGNFVAATDQVGARQREIRGHDVHRTQRREHPTTDLEQLLGGAQVPQPVLAETPYRERLAGKLGGHP